MGFESEIGNKNFFILKKKNEEEEEENVKRNGLEKEIVAMRDTVRRILRRREERDQAADIFLSLSLSSSSSLSLFLSLTFFFSLVLF